MDWYEAISFWRWGNSAFGAFHLYAAICSLVVGPIVLFRHKGDITHRLLGMIYVIAMYITNLSALSLYSFTGAFNFFHYAAIGSLLTLTVGFVAIIIYGANRSRVALDWHLQMMPWSYLGLVLAAIAESAVRGLPRLFDGISDMSEFWPRIYAIIGISGVLGFIVTFVLVARTRKRWMKTLTPADLSVD